MSFIKTYKFASSCLQLGSKTAWWLWLESEWWPTYRCNDLSKLCPFKTCDQTFLADTVASLSHISWSLSRKVVVADPGADGGSHLAESQPSHSYAVLFHPYSCPNIQYLKNLGLLLKFLIFSQFKEIVWASQAKAERLCWTLPNLTQLSLCCHSTNSWRRPAQSYVS